MLRVKFKLLKALTFLEHGHFTRSISVVPQCHLTSLLLTCRGTTPTVRNLLTGCTHARQERHHPQIRSFGVSPHTDF
jgi:hypothetical protein